MKKKIVLMTSALMAMGLLAGYANVQKDSTPVYAEPEATNVIIEDTNEYYSYPAVVVNLYNKTEKMTFYFAVNDSADSYTSANHKLNPNKVYTLSEMRTNNSYARIDETEYPYKSASLELLSDANGFIGYLASVTLEDDTVYNIVEAEPMSGEMVIDEYKVEYGSRITLADTETGSKFYFVISNIEDGVTYTLSDFSMFKYCYIGGDRYWDYREATFKRTTDDAGLIHVEATVLTEHGDSLSLKYNEVAVTGVALNKSSTTIKYGGNETLIATVSPDNATNKNVSWSSSDESVATVDEAGKVTAVNVGSAVITATTEVGEFKATCAVTVSESAVSVTNKINALPTPENVTLDDKDAIEAARKAYDSLDADEKALVTTETLKKLTDDEAAYQNLVDTAAANAVIEKINALPQPNAVTINDGEAIKAARAAYDVLTDAQKAKVSAEVLKKLTDDEAALAKEEADTAAANAVIEKINALPQPNAVTINDGEVIKAARTAYDALTQDQKAKVSAEILKKLTDDETAYAKVAADTEAANKVIELINALPSASDVTKNDKEAIEAARAAYEALTEDQKAKISNDVLQLLVNDENALKSIPTGLPAGAIVGIVIGSIFGFLLIACVVLFLLNKKGIINIPFLNKKRKKDESNN